MQPSPAAAIAEHTAEHGGQGVALADTVTEVLAVEVSVADELDEELGDAVILADELGDVVVLADELGDSDELAVILVDALSDALGDSLGDSIGDALGCVLGDELAVTLADSDMLADRVIAGVDDGLQRNQQAPWSVALPRQLQVSGQPV